jgi:hypothetical protein
LEDEKVVKGLDWSKLFDKKVAKSQEEIKITQGIVGLNKDASKREKNIIVFEIPNCTENVLFHMSRIQTIVNNISFLIRIITPPATFFLSLRIILYDLPLYAKSISVFSPCFDSVITQTLG